MNTTKLISKKGFIKFCLIFSAFFPVLPFSLKGVVVIIFGVLALLSLKNRTNKFNNIYLINASIFVFYLISLTYTQDIERGFTVLETRISILIFPIIFFLISGNSQLTKTVIKLLGYFKKWFIGSSFILCTLVFISVFKIEGFKNNKLNLNGLLGHLDTGFFWLEDHPIYISIYIALSLLMIISVYNNTKSKYKKYLVLVALLQLVTLIVLARKGVILSLLLVVITYTLFLFKKKIKELLLLFALVSIGVIFLFNFYLDTGKRFKEVFDVKSYKKVESYSSTSIRYFVYKCALQKASDEWLVGYGIGDVDNELNNCYKTVSKVLVNNGYNSHNQYLSIILAVGFLGLLFFLTSMVLCLKIFLNTRNYFSFFMLLFFILVMLVENVLERQNGVILFTFLVNLFLLKTSTSINSNENKKYILN